MTDWIDRNGASTVTRVQVQVQKMTVNVAASIPKTAIKSVSI